jgi:CheY-like chemotaxis protein
MARLLIVVDNLELAALISASANARGHAAQPTYSLEQAQILLEASEWDALLVDLGLGGGDPAELLEGLGGPLPLFAVGGPQHRAFATQALSAGRLRAFFEKPFFLRAVLGAVEQLEGGPHPPPVPPDEPDDLPLLAQPIATEDELPFTGSDAAWAPAASAEPAAESADKSTPDPAADIERGSLTAEAIPRLLTAYYLAKHTGELKLRRGPVLKAVFFEDGQPIYAASNLVQERFARFCVRRGMLSEEDMAAVADLAREGKLRTGEAMVRLGLLSPEQRRELLAEQIKEIIWSTFGWTSGEFTFSARYPDRQDLVKLTVFPGDLVVDGGRRLPLVELRSRMAGQRRLFPTSDPPFPLHLFQLSGPQALLLACADGSKTVDDLLTLSELEERDTLGTLLGLELAGILEERRSGRPRISFLL